MKTANAMTNEVFTKFAYRPWRGGAFLAASVAKAVTDRVGDNTTRNQPTGHATAENSHWNLRNEEDDGGERMCGPSLKLDNLHLD